jgi:hypothetical protein
MTPYALAPAAGYALLHAVWQAALLGVIGALVLAKVHRASTRHAIGLVVLFAMLVLPVATFAFYRTVPRCMFGVGSGALRSEWIAGVWFVGVGAMLARQLVSWLAVIALDRRARSVPRIDELRRAFGIARPVAARTGRAASPFTAYALRPVIWLPTAWDRLSSAERDALLAHELAHVRRLDWIWNGLQCLAEAVLWFHPAVWWSSRRIRQDREHACDDLAVATCGDPIALAEALATLERERFGALVLAARGDGPLLQRTRRLLVGEAPRIRAPAHLFFVLGLGAAVASQLALPLVGVRIDGSVKGPLTPGSYREITADGIGRRDHYRMQMDVNGHTAERYERDGEPRTIDRGVRAWFDDLAAVGD